jgi:serine-type D-Ala-D-Ala carboxypeptidase/endopeptidase (penicillin-binding protein 4)
MRGCAALVALIVCSPPAAAQLPPGIARVLAGLAISAEDVSIVVQAVDADEPVLSHEAGVARNPASVMKLVTTWVALEFLGPDYRWPTEIYFLGDFDGRTLAGDLAIKGYGDPFLVVEEYWKMLRAVRRLGLQTIEGDLLLDDSFFDVVEDDPGAFDGQPFRTYNVVPNALLVNFKAVNFQFLVDESSARVNIAMDPILDNLEIRNGIKLVDGACRGYQAGISFDAGGSGTNRATFGGEFSRRCGLYGMSRTVLEHDTYAYGLFETLWAEIGGTFRGELRRGSVAGDARPVLTWRSPPLGEIIRSINKNSNNVMTRQLLYTIGAEAAGPPGRRESGIAAIDEFLTSRGIAADSLVVGNGAGLSRDTRVSAELLVDLLRSAAQSPFAPEFIASLSLGGLDGTTRGRYASGRANGRMHVKSGRLDHVSALAGYVHARSGETYTVAIMTNTNNAHRGLGQEVEAAVIDWILTLN